MAGFRQPLWNAAHQLGRILANRDDGFAWVAQEVGSSCGDSVRHDLRCQIVAWLEDELSRIAITERFVMQVLESGRALRPLITMSESSVVSSQMELVRTSPLSCDEHPSSPSLRSLIALTLSVDTPENHGFGYHLHPCDDRSGKHFGYKLLFDPRAGQKYLAWELHGSGERPWGRPADRPLERAHSQRLHGAALRAVRGSVIAPRGAKFRTWAALFERPGRTAYVAAPFHTKVETWAQKERTGW